MSLLKKFTSAAAAFAVAASAVGSTLTAAASSEFADYADALAQAGVITAQADEAKYRLSDNITRAEIAKIAVNLAGIDAPTATDKVFGDVTTAKIGDLAAYVEAAAEAGIVSKLNANFRPLDLVTRAELIKMLLSAKGVEASTVDAGFKDLGSDATLNGYINAAANEGYISKVANFRPNDTATRGEAFKIAANVEGLMDTDVIDTPVDTSTGTDTSTDTPVTVVKAGALEVALSPATAAANSLPKGAAGVPVASFDFTAGSADVTVSSLLLKQVGLGGGTTLSDVAVFSSMGRASKVKTSPFDNTDKQATLTLTNGFVVKAGTTETLTVVASVNSSATISAEFALELAGAASIASSAETVSATFPVVGNTMKVASVNAGQVTIAADGTPSSITLGQKNAEVAKFKLTESSTEKETILVSQITLKETGTIDEGTEINNFELYADSVKVASVASANDKYVTFKLATPVAIKDGGNVKFSVRADIVGGPADTIQLGLEKSLDITAVGTLYNVGVAVVGSYTSSALTVKAGQIAISYVDATATQFLKAKTDIVLGTITVANTQGKNLEIAAANVLITNTNAAGSGVNALIENVELVDVSNASVYELSASDTSTTATGVTFSDTDLSIPVGATKTFQVRADSKDVVFTAGNKLAISLSNLGGSTTSAGLLIQETEDDTAVTDVTPSALSFKSVEAVSASATATTLPLSAAKTVVVGSKDIEALSFELKAGDASALKVREIKVAKASGTLAYNNTAITAVKLYKDSVSDANLVKQVGGSSIDSDGNAVFNDISVAIAKNATQKFVVTVSIVDDQALSTKTIALRVAATAGFDVEDYDNDDVTVSGTVVSARTITVTGIGTLAVDVDNTNSKADKAKSVLAGTTSSEVAAVKLTATNEAITAKDIKVTFTGSTATGTAAALASVSLYKADGSLIATKTVTSDEVTFEDVNYAVAEGSETIYVKVTTNKVGKDQVGIDATLTATVAVTDAEGVSSKKVVTATNVGTASKAFAVSSVRVSAVAFVSSYAGVAQATKLTAGTNNLAIIAVTADNTTNTLQASSEVLKTVVKSFKLTANENVSLTGITVEKIGGNGTTASLTGGVVSSVSDIGTDAQIAAGETAYFLVKGSVTLSGIAGDQSVQISLANLNSSAIVYGNNDGGADVTALNLSTTTLDGAKISD